MNIDLFSRVLVEVCKWKTLLHFQPLARNIFVFYEINLTHYTVLKYKLCLKFVFYKVCVPIFVVSGTWG